MPSPGTKPPLDKVLRQGVNTHRKSKWATKETDKIILDGVKEGLTLKKIWEDNQDVFKEVKLTTFRGYPAGAGIVFRRAWDKVKRDGQMVKIRAMYDDALDTIYELANQCDNKEVRLKAAERLEKIMAKYLRALGDPDEKYVHREYRDRFAIKASAGEAEIMIVSDNDTDTFQPNEEN